jgi:hypothetical protein
LQAARDGIIKQERINESLKRIAAFKALMPKPVAFDAASFQKLSDEIAALNSTLNYTYGGTL